MDGNPSKHYVTIFLTSSVAENSPPLQTLEPDKCQGWEWVHWNDIWKIKQETPDILFEPLHHFLESFGSDIPPFLLSQPAYILGDIDNMHQIMQTPAGSRSGGEKRRACGRCRYGQCPYQAAAARPKTTWYCSYCKVFLHPGTCFEEFHKTPVKDKRRKVTNQTLDSFSVLNNA